MREKQLQDAFEAWLRKIGIPFLRSRMDKATTIRKGWPDFSIFWMSHCLFIETKVGKGKLGKDQERVIAEIRRSACRVEICRTVEECIEACKTILCVGKEIANTEPLSSDAARSGIESTAAPKSLGRAGNFIGRFNGADYVFRGDRSPGGQCEMVRRATAADLINIK